MEKEQTLQQRIKSGKIRREDVARRRTVEPALRKICRTYLALEGLDDRMEIVWDEISLQDMTEQDRAELYKAQAEKIHAECKMQNAE